MDSVQPPPPIVQPTGSYDFRDPVPSLTDILKERSDALTEQVLGDRASLGGMNRVFSALAKPRLEEPEHESWCVLSQRTPEAHMPEPKCTCNPDEWEAIY